MQNPIVKLTEWAGGSMSELASRLGLSRYAVYLWKVHGIPRSRGLWLEDKTSGAVKAQDIYDFADFVAKGGKPAPFPMTCGTCGRMLPKNKIVEQEKAPA
jgi:hypothetical protein